MNKTDLVDKAYLRSDLPEFRPGDTVKVHVRVVEGNRERVQVFQGVVIRRQNGGLQETFTVRKISFGVGVERTFPVHSPSIAKLEIVTRGHVHDEEALYHLAVSPAGYLGMIGSKRKIKLIYDDLAARGVPGAALAKVHAPLGFAIGSQTVPEIAISIVAELIACRNLGHV